MEDGSIERLSYTINEKGMDWGYIKFSWERLRLFMRFKTDVIEQAMSNIIAALDVYKRQDQGTDPGNDTLYPPRSKARTRKMYPDRKSICRKGLIC